MARNTQLLQTFPRADHWGLAGYERDTTPRLGVLNNMIFFPNAVSVTAATRTAVPIILSKTTANDISVGNFKTSWISDFKRAGFEVYWLSMQMPVGVHDTAIGIYASLANRVQYLNFGSYLNRGGVDDALLPELSKVLADGNKKRLIVLHTLGSHSPYQRRYPPKFEIFKPVPGQDSVPNLFDATQKELIVNSYDNSILYTDFILSAIAEKLRQQAGTSLMWYASDHGQSLFDPGCSMAGHGFFSKYNFHIPVLFWYSDDYAKRHNDELQAIRKNSRERVYMGDFYLTFLQSAGFKLSGAERKNSFSNAGYISRERLVTIDGGRVINYDKDLANASCKL
ncbi:phosphoethanolamine transferase [Pseudomonas nitroreducens]|uniref:phosphoethanolamine transferase n=1 Tax=Pseudomonas nitroreducens TaxID=46680 RepID=UPI001473F2BD|nr:phosphoethanolamine transferase [Pseudomonas nitroreducens]NMZ74653.1 phosphoethanolamine transferase [Pseudomonas nitroreducens]